MDCKESIGGSSMKLRTKIKLAAVLIVVASTVGATFLGYWAIKIIFTQRLQASAMSLTSAVAASIDPQMLVSIRIEMDEKAPQYAKLETLIQELTAANQNGDFPIRYVYLLMPTTKGAKSGWDFAVDSDPRTIPEWIGPGTPYNMTLINDSAAQVIPQTASTLYIKDEWGEWLSGFAPIRTKEGTVVGLVGADIPFINIVHFLDIVFWVAIGFSSVVSLVSYFAVSLTINKSMKPLTDVRGFIHDIGLGMFSKRLKLPMKGEFAVVVGELNEMASKLERQKDELSAITAISEDLNFIQDIDILMESILQKARKLIGCDAGSVYLQEGEWLSLRYVQNESMDMKNDRKGSAMKFSPISISGESIAGYVAKTGKILNIQDAYDISPNSPFRFNQSFDTKSGYRTKAMLTVPLRTSAGKNVGVLQLINPIDKERQPRLFREDDEKMIGHFESAATVALERAALTRSLINRMIKMAELRDPSETAVHCDRVAAYSVILYEGWAKRRGLETKKIQHERDVIGIAARLHDVGKVGISDVILKKPGRLTAEEYSAMQEHTVFGARLFRGNDSVLDRAAIDVTLHHHERWDGGGYPGDRDGEITSDSVDAPPSSGIGLKGEGIPLFARIVSVADVFDALSSKRMYKEAWPEDRVLAEMKVNAGKQFDPELIEIMFENVDMFRAIHDRYDSSETTKKTDFKEKSV